VSSNQNFSRQLLRTKEQFQKHTCHPTNRFYHHQRTSRWYAAQSTVIHCWRPREIEGKRICKRDMKRLRKVFYTPTNLNQHLINRLQNNDDNLIRIIFSSRNLGSSGVTTLMHALRGNTHLCALDLSSNRIEAEGALSIASLLIYQGTGGGGCHQRSRSENCNGNNMSSNNSMIVSGNNNNSSRGIKTLILCDNNLLDEGVHAIATALETNQLLESLMLDDNYIGVRGLVTLANSLMKNSRLERLHLKHNSFTSLSPLITCLFNKQSLDHVVDSNHTLKYIFLDCGYSYESTELETLLKINRLGKVEARRTKVAMYLEEDLYGRLFSRTTMDNNKNVLDYNAKLCPHVLSILAQCGSIHGVFGVVRNLHSAIFTTTSTQCDGDYDVGMTGLCMDEDNDCMEVEYL
jgi:hypothetical protein